MRRAVVGNGVVVLPGVVMGGEELWFTAVHDLYVAVGAVMDAIDAPVERAAISVTALEVGFNRCTPSRCGGWTLRGRGGCRGSENGLSRIVEQTR